MLRPAQSIILCVITLLVIGVVMVNSAGMEVQPLGQPDSPETDTAMLESILFGRSTVYMLLALAAMAATALLPIRRIAESLSLPAAATPSTSPRDLRLLALATLALLAILSMVYWPVIGREVNYSSRWIGVGIPGVGEVRAQPSEVAKWALIALLAWYAARNARHLPSFFRGLLPALAATGIVAAFILKEDLGTAILIGAVACAILIAAGARVWQFLILSPPALAILGWAVLASDYRRARLTAFLDPFADPADTGYHMIQSMAAVAGGEGPGRGLGHGLQKFGYLPEDKTDFLFAIICEELGIAGAALVIALFAILIWSCHSVLKREPNLILRLFALGVMTTVGLQAVINLFVVTGLGPTKGIALPLVSSGGTGWILTAASLGILVAADRSRESPSGLPDAAESSGDSRPGEAREATIALA